MIAHLPARPGQGEVSRRTRTSATTALPTRAPSFTIISNRCAHLGCPVQPNGPILDDKTKTMKTRAARRDDHPDDPRRRLRLSVPRRPVRPGGQPHRRARRSARSTASSSRSERPPRAARSLQRRKVDGTGAAAEIHKYPLTGPGQHVDGPESWLYPLQPPALMATTTKNEEAATDASIQVASYPIDWLEERSGPHRRRQVLPLPQGAGRHRLVPHARLGDTDGVPRPGD